MLVRRHDEEAHVESRGIGMLVVAVGVVIVVVGLLVMTGVLSWFGRLPGDVRIEGERSRVYFPITSMIVVSVVLSLLLWIFRR